MSVSKCKGEMEGEKEKNVYVCECVFVFEICVISV